MAVQAVVGATALLKVAGSYLCVCVCVRVKFEHAFSMGH